MNKEILKYPDTPTKYVDVDGIRYAYRMLGKHADIPLVCLQHFTGTLDNWDPTIINGLAQDRRVVTIDNAVCHENRKKPCACYGHFPASAGAQERPRQRNGDAGNSGAGQGAHTLGH